MTEWGNVVCPKEQQEMKDTIHEALQNMDFFEDIEVKDNV